MPRGVRRRARLLARCDARAPTKNHFEHAKAPQVHFLHMPHNVERMATSDADYYELGHQPPNLPWWKRIPLIPAIGAGASLLVVCSAATVWHNVQSTPTATSTDAAAPTAAPATGKGASTTARLLITNG